MLPTSVVVEGASVILFARSMPLPNILDHATLRNLISARGIYSGYLLNGDRDRRALDNHIIPLLHSLITYYIHMFIHYLTNTFNIL